MNKKWEALNEIDRTLRKVFPPGPSTPAVQVVIEKISGFELFNTRPYHNYETWSDGYRITGAGVRVQEEDLDDAVRKFVQIVQDKRAGKQIPSWLLGVVPDE